MIDYRDKEGHSISLKDYGDLFCIKDYQIVKQETVCNCCVSTVWLGVPHYGSFGYDYYYETMIFNQEGVSDEEYMERYRTLFEAKEGHKEAIKSVQCAHEEKDE
jgi:hypothetical protein